MALQIGQVMLELRGFLSLKSLVPRTNRPTNVDEAQTRGIVR